MSSYASKSVAKAIKKSYDSRDDEGDFSVALKNGKQLKIHSWILKQHSEVLGKG